jgi:hypothetical protein
MLDNRMLVNVLGVQDGITVQISNTFRHAIGETWLYANVRLVKNLAELKPVLLHNCFACIRDWQEGYENGSHRANFVVFKIEINTDNDTWDVLRRSVHHLFLLVLSVISFHDGLQAAHMFNRDFFCFGLCTCQQVLGLPRV